MVDSLSKPSNPVANNQPPDSGINPLPDSPPPQDVKVNPIPLPSVPMENPVIRPPQPLSPPPPPAGAKHSRFPKPMIAGISALVFLLVALGSGLYLVGKQGVGEIRKQAITCTNQCTEGQTTCRQSDNTTCTCVNTDGAELGCTSGDYWMWQCGGAACTPASTPTSTPTPAPGGGTTYDCHYENPGGANAAGTVSVTGADCGLYTFRALKYECERRNESDYDRCQPGTPGFGLTLRDQTPATSVTIDSAPNCKRQQADLIIVSRPNDGKSGDDLPGTPVNPNYKIVVGTQNNCGGGGATPTPGATATPTSAVSAQCVDMVLQFPTGGGWRNATSGEVPSPGQRIRFLATGSLNTGSFTRGAFYVNGVLHTDDVVKVDDTHFGLEYTTSAAGGNLSVGAVLFHNSQGWVD